MDKKYLIAKLHESVPEEERNKRLYVVDGKSYSFGEIVNEIEQGTDFGFKLAKAIDRVLRK